MITSILKVNLAWSFMPMLFLVMTGFTSFAQTDPVIRKETALLKYSPTALLLEESFDEQDFPPTGWQNIQLTGTGLWARTTAGVHPPCAPHSGAGMAFYNDYDFGQNVSAMLVTPALTLPAGLPKDLNFWMHRDNEWPGYPDSLAVYYNSTPVLTGATFLGKIFRYNWETGWFEFNFTLPASVAGTFYFIFKANSNWGNDMFIDDIRIQVLHANDAGMVSVVSPPAMVIEGDVVPEVIIKNYGTQSLTEIPVKYKNGQTGQVFTQIVPSLDSAATAQVVFPAWSATPGGPYEFTFYTDLPGDENQSNDTLVRQIICTGSNQSYSHSFSGGLYHSLSICNDKTLMAWGSNTEGQLGDGTNTDSNIPVQVANLTDVIRISAGKYHSIALKADGTVWCFGNNGSGQLGNGGTVSSNVPVQVSGLSNITGVAGGDSHTLALKDDGTVWAWGGNTWGQLGNGTLTNSEVPVQVSGLTGVFAIACGADFSLALLNDGKVMAWGANQYGQLGNGTLVWCQIPCQVSDLTGVTGIAGGTEHSVAFTGEGTVWAWGSNSLGQLGDGSNVNSWVPVRATGLSGISAISAGGASSYAVKYDGTAWAWGWNSNGQLGNGTTVNSSLPVQVTGLSSTIAIDAGAFHALSMDQDGELDAWGFNAYGQLGNGTNDDSYVPVVIAGLCPVYMSAGKTEKSGSEQVILYPNPSDGHFRLQIESADGSLNDGTVEIFNACGEKVLVTATDPAELAQIDLTGKGKGFFIVRVTTSGDVRYGKLIIH